MSENLLINEAQVHGDAPLGYVLQYKLWSQIEAPPSAKFYTACWNFTGNRTEFGHGRFGHRKRIYLAHRVAYEQATGLKLADDQVVRHKCDNPRCVNPLHLEAGTTADNNLDMLSRGRNPKGVTHGMALLTPTQVREIRWLFATAGQVRGAARAIQERFKLSKKVVLDVTSKTTWKSLPDAFETLNPKPAPLTAEELKFRLWINNRGNSRLTPDKIQLIRALKEAGAPAALISAKVGGLAWGAISQICNRKSWVDVPQPAMPEVLTPAEIAEARSAGERCSRSGANHHNARLSPQQVREIRWLYADYAQTHSSSYGAQQALADRYEVTKAMINQVVSRRSWKELPDDFDTLLKPAPLAKPVITRTRQ